MFVTNDWLEPNIFCTMGRINLIIANEIIMFKVPKESFPNNLIMKEELLRFYKV